MRVHRLVKARHAGSALDGEGARRVGGRWNAPGIPVAYCASTLSLAVLELLVHVDPISIPEDLVAEEIDIPDGLPMADWRPGNLPERWREEAGKPALQAMGGAWARAGASGVLRVPSVIVPAEPNVLINPAHPDAGRIRRVAQAPFTQDPRLFR